MFPLKLLMFLLKFSSEMQEYANLPQTITQCSKRSEKSFER